MSPITDKSKLFLEKSEQLIANQSISHKRNQVLFDLGYPTFAERAEGTHFFDVEGNKYLDYLLAFGPVLLGYNDPRLNDAIRDQLEKGMIYSLSSPLEVSVAKKITEIIPYAEKVAFFLTGSAATEGAIRMARAYTQKDYVITCGCHGWSDWAQTNCEGVPYGIAKYGLEVEYNNLAAAEGLFKEHPEDIACWILESARGEGPAPEFLMQAQKLCHEHSALFIMDEIKIGFRAAFGGISEYYGLTPDLATFGKAIGNGYPASFIVGKKEIMDAGVNLELSSTFNGDLLSLTAISTVIDIMKEQNGIAHQWKLGKQLMDGINRVNSEAGFEFSYVGLPPMPSPSWGNEAEEEEDIKKVFQYCLSKGIYIHPFDPIFFTLSHTEKDIQNTLNCWKEGVEIVLKQKRY